MVIVCELGQAISKSNGIFCRHAGTLMKLATQCSHHCTILLDIL